MDLSNNKAVIICAGIEGWYPAGIRRLLRTLNFEGWGGEVLTWTDYPEGCPLHEHVPYYFKIAAFEEAFRRGFTHVLWVDASFFAVANPMPIFDIINEQGYYFFSSGFNLAQSVSDYALQCTAITRDEAAGANEWASGCVGINIENPDGSKLYRMWKEYMDAGLSIGSRQHDNQSHDPRFLFHRQDQSCLSLAAYKLGLKNTRGLDHVAYKGTGYDPNQIIFFIKSL